MLKVRTEGSLLRRQWKKSPSTWERLNRKADRDADHDNALNVEPREFRMATTGWWQSPVPVMLRNSATVLLVNNNLQAADILQHRWPTKGGSKQRAACEAVMEALEQARDQMALAKAQKAFAEAAKEADILIE
ncbi:DUF982 domain-containing protein [Mesorhizobium sp. IMUNJ 23232]|uniref:DUF982 domain-containing protein n=1 Tax=Mesorhizobium sp. IMUNJ 23232 TaxID=3376064 RepID=UPI003799335C